MARKRDYRAEYAKRIARATAEGKTRQQARGHKAGEHIERARKERAKEGLSAAERESIRRWWEKNQDAARVESGWPTLAQVVAPLYSPTFLPVPAAT